VNPVRDTIQLTRRMANSQCRMASSFDAGAADGLEHGAAGRSLESKGGDVVRLLDEVHIEAEGRSV